MFDLNDMSLTDLKRLHTDVARAIGNYEERKKRDALEALTQVAKEHGFELSDLTGISIKKARRPATVKYAHPADPSRSWTGRGRMPAWFSEALATGAKREDLAVSK